MDNVLQNGKCVGTGQHDLFFSERPQDLAAAQAICHTCQVRIDCLQLALKDGLDWGVWGGVIFWDGEVFHRKRGRGRPSRGEVHLPVAANRAELLDLTRSA
jgi:WhiB family redox-sensing transcriptional regulator